MQMESCADLISIIVPVYNMEQYLERCMESIINQTYPTLEIILVDDGSTDRSPQLCDAYAKKDSRIRVVHKPNGGLSDARNAGLAIATGTYIGYVDSDDWIELDMYERMYSACVENGAQLAVCRYASEHSADAACHSMESGSGTVVPLSREELLKIYICGHDKYIIYNSVWSKLFHRDLVQDMLFPKGRNSEDIMYTTRAFCKLKKAVYLDTSLYHYVLDRAGSIMNVTKGERMFWDEIPFWREHISYIRETVSDTMGDLAAYYFWRRLLFYYIDMMQAGKQGKAYAKRLVSEVRVDRMEIDKVYHSAIVSKGDFARMKLFLFSPLLYAWTVQLYNKIVIPLRRGRYITVRRNNAF